MTTARLSDKINNKSVSEIVIISQNGKIEKGANHGLCSLCGYEREDLLLTKYRDTFAGFVDLHESEYICPFCNAMYEDSKYRYNNWVAYPGEFKILKRYEVLPEILNPKELPFVIYTTTSYQKKGWTVLFNKGLNYSRNFFFIAMETLLLHSTRKQIMEYYNLIQDFLELKISREQIKTGHIAFSSFRKIEESLKKRYINTMLKERNNPTWQWAVTFTPKREENNG